MSTGYTFRDIAGLTRFLKVLLGLGMVVAAVSLLSSLMQAELLSRGSFSEAEGQANDSREQVIGILQLLLYLLTAVVFGRWIVRANKNVRALGAKDLRITPGWAVGYFFVPIVNLWKPYQAMKDLWRASHDLTSWGTAPASSILPAWWTLWILSNVLGHMSFRMTMAARGLEGLQAATWVQMAGEAMDIPLCLVAMTLVIQVGNGLQTHAQTST
jgi:phosphatidylglycerophosphate synthase